MNNLKLQADRDSSRGSSDGNYIRSVSKQSTHTNGSTGKQTSKPPLNNSSSQSSLPKMSNIMDNQSKMVAKKSNFAIDEGKRHETIKVEKQTTKPLMAKFNGQESNSPMFSQSIDPSIIKPNLTQSTSNSVHQSREFVGQGKRKEESKHEPFVHPQSKRVEKQDSSSNGSQQEQQDDEAQDSSDEEQEQPQPEESDEDEFPVALNRLVFSFLPQDVAEDLNDKNDWKKRTTAIQKMENLIKKQLRSPNDDFPIYITDICKKMCKMMHDSNFKISLTSLRIVHSLCQKYSKEISE